MAGIEFEKSIVVYEKLKSYGFEFVNHQYKYSTEIMNGQFMLYVTIAEDEKINTKLIDTNTDEEYVLHLTDSEGAYVGAVKTAYQSVLDDIKNQCFRPSAFQSDDAQAVLTYTKRQYNGELEFLWEKTPDTAIIRNADTQKWYAAFMHISKRKLGIDSDEIVCIIDLHIKKEDNAGLVDNQIIFPGYHMNKQSWITICLDGSVEKEKIYKLIDSSYELSKKK